MIHPFHNTRSKKLYISLLRKPKDKITMGCKLRRDELNNKFITIFHQTQGCITRQTSGSIGKGNSITYIYLEDKVYNNV